MNKHTSQQCWYTTAHSYSSLQHTRQCLQSKAYHRSNQLGGRADGMAALPIQVPLSAILYPCPHVHMYEPTVFLQIWWQVSIPKMHSSMSVIIVVVKMFQVCMSSFHCDALTITCASIPIEGVAKIASTTVAPHCVVAVLFAQICSQCTFINIYQAI
jgi:hypothetical protein